MVTVVVSVAASVEIKTNNNLWCQSIPLPTQWKATRLSLLVSLIRLLAMPDRTREDVLVAEEATEVASDSRASNSSRDRTKVVAEVAEEAAEVAVDGESEAYA